MKKKLTAVMMAAAMVLSLSACGNAENSGNDAQIEETQQVTEPETEEPQETEAEDAQEEEQPAEAETVTEELQQREEEPDEARPELSNEDQQLVEEAAGIDGGSGDLRRRP